MKLMTKYKISAINSCWAKCDEKYLWTGGRTDRQKDGRTKVKQYTPLRWSGGIINIWMKQKNKHKIITVISRSQI